MDINQEELKNNINFYMLNLAKHNIEEIENLKKTVINF